MVSGRENLRLFARFVGFEGSTITRKLEAHLSSIKEESKTSNFSIAIQGKTLSSLLSISGVFREGFSQNRNSSAKNLPWYKAYEAAIRQNIISRRRNLIRGLENLLTCRRRRLEEGESRVSTFYQGSILDLMSSGTN